MLGRGANMFGGQNSGVSGKPERLKAPLKNGKQKRTTRRVNRFFRRSIEKGALFVAEMSTSCDCRSVARKVHRH